MLEVCHLHVPRYTESFVEAVDVACRVTLIDDNVAQGLDVGEPSAVFLAGMC